MDSSKTPAPSNVSSFITLSKTDTKETTENTQNQTVKNVSQFDASHIPPPLNIRQSTNFDCLHEFEGFMSCIRLLHKNILLFVFTVLK